MKERERGKDTDKHTHFLTGPGSFFLPSFWFNKGRRIKREQEGEGRDAWDGEKDQQRRRQVVAGARRRSR